MKRSRTLVFFWLLLAVTAFGLGLWGAWREQLAADDTPSVLRCFLSTAVMFVLDFGNLDEPRDTVTLVAALLALLVTGSGLVVAGRDVLRRRLELRRAGRLTGHAVLVGCDSTGQRALDALLRSHRRVVVVDTREEVLASLRARYPQGRVLCVAGDGCDASSLRGVSLSRAINVVITPANALDVLDAVLEFQAGSDGSVRPRFLFRTASTAFRQAFLDCFIRAGRSKLLLDFGCYDRRTSLTRDCLWRHGPERYSSLSEKERAPRIAIVAPVDWAEIFLMELAHVAHYPGRQRLQVEVVSDGPFRWSGPSALQDLLQIHWVVAEHWDVVAQHVEDAGKDGALDVIYACLTTVADVLRVRGPRPGSTTMIGLSEQVFSATVEAMFDGQMLYLPDYSPWNECADLDSMARVLHEDYRVHHPEADLPEWEGLTFIEREANRKSVLHLPVKLCALGYELCESDEAEQFLEVPEDLAWELAPMEHARWVAEKQLAGVVLGEREPGVSHPDLVPWEKSTKIAQQKDVEVMRCVPRLVSAGGLHVRRVQAVGAIGD